MSPAWAPTSPGLLDECDAAGGRVLVVACPQSEDEPVDWRCRHVIAPACLSGLSPVFPLLAKARGVSGVIARPCLSRACREIVETWESLWPDIVNRYADGEAARVGWRRARVHRVRLDASRRFFLGGVGEPQDEVELARQAWEALECQGRVSDAVAAAPWWLPLEAHGCVACGVCVRACPHGALRGVEDADRWELVHDREACRGEGVCVELCPHGALRATHEQVGGQGVLATVTVARCRSCGARIVAGADLCEVCTYRTANPFGSFIPPGASSGGGGGDAS